MHFTFSVSLILLKEAKISINFVKPLFGAAHAAPNNGITILYAFSQSSIFNVDYTVSVNDFLYNILVLETCQNVLYKSLKMSGISLSFACITMNAKLKNIIKYM